MAASTSDLTLQEKVYYESIFRGFALDPQDLVNGKDAAMFLAKSGLPRDTLHVIWSLADRDQRGSLDIKGFGAACRLIAHAQSGSTPNSSLISQAPPGLPMFDTKPASHSPHPHAKLDDVISLSDAGTDVNAHFVDPKQLERIAMNLGKSGLDPLDSIPFNSISGSLKNPRSDDWSISEASRQKYMDLFQKNCPDQLGRLTGKSVRTVLERSGLSKNLLGSIWELADSDGDGYLSEREFIVAMHLTSRCKQGWPLPSELPGDLLKQLEPNKTDVPSFGNDQHHVSADSWKYSRTYLRDPAPHFDGAVITEQTEEEVRYNFDMCAQVEGDLLRMNAELEKRKSSILGLERSRAELQERKLNVANIRKNMNMNRITAGRDRAKLQSDIFHLKKVLQESSADVEIMRQAVMELSGETNRAVSQLKALELQRKEAIHEHSLEVDKIAFEQRETSNLIESCQRSGREREVQLEGAKLQKARMDLISDMQLKPRSREDPISYAASPNNTNKWATAMLQAKDMAGIAPSMGFGVSFFENVKRSHS
jgi:hypothetical protein